MKQYHRYKIDFDSEAVVWSGVCMGVSIFALVAYYLGLERGAMLGAGAKLIHLWLPLVLCTVYTLLLRIFRWNAPGLYAVFGCLFCLLLMISLFSCGNVLRIVLGVIGYLLCGALLVFAAGGYLPGRLPASVGFGVILAVRLLCFDLGKISGLDWIPEIAQLCMIAGLMLLPIGMIPGSKKQ